MTSEPRDVEAALNLRTFIDRLRQAGKLKEVRDAHWDLEVGALTEIAAESGEGSALLFDAIPDHPAGYRVLSNVLRSPESDALALGMPPDVRGLDVVHAVKGRLQDLKPIPPAEIGESPLLENVAFDNDVNVLKFPTPKWHADDGGRYIGTFTATVCRDPDTGYVNVGTYRVQVHDEKTVGVWMIPGKHGDLITRKYWARGESCPVAVVCGLPPGMMTASAVGIPWNMSEYDFLGGLLETPVPVIKGQKTGLPVPAFADIVLEGSIPPPEQETHEEGPFGEWPGYYASGSRQAPVVKVEAVYHRDDPIITGDPPLRTFLNSETHKYIRSANIWSAMERAGIPDVQGVWFPKQGRFVVTVAVRQRYSGHAKQAGYGVLATRDGGRDVRMVIVVDEDVDITNMGEVLWAMSTRWDPRTDSEVLDVAASILNPRLSPEDKERRELTTGCMVVDACRPYAWKEEFPGISGVSAEYKAQVRAKWADKL